MKPYDRRTPPNDLDHAAFSVEVPVLTISRHPQVPRRPAELSTAAAHFMLEPVTCQAAEVLNKGFYADAREERLRSRECRIQMSVARLGNVLSFLPEGALLMESPCSLVEESLWHRRLHYSEHFRNDAATNWAWRYRGDPGPAVIDVPGCTAFAYHPFAGQYYHWFIDCAPQFWALSRLNPYRPALPQRWFCNEFGEGSFQHHTLKMFGIDEASMLTHPRKAQAVYRFEELHFWSNAYWESVPSRPHAKRHLIHKGWSREYLTFLNRAARGYIQDARERGRRRIWCSRSDAKHRRVANEDEVVRALEKRGFDIVAPGMLPFTEQVRLFSEAEVVLGPHGAGLTNMLWTPEDCTLIEIFPHLFEDAGYFTLCGLLGRRYACLLAQTLDTHPLGLANPKGLARADLAVDVSRLEAELDRMGL